MNEIQFVTDEKGRRVAVQLDLKKHRALWEEIEDVLVSRSRCQEKRISLEKVKEGLIKSGQLAPRVTRFLWLRAQRKNCRPSRRR